MSGVLVVRPMPLAVPVVAGSGAANLLTADPNEVWAAASAAVLEMRVDLGGLAAVDSFYLGYTNASADAVWSVHTTTAPGGGAVERYVGAMRAADSLGPRHHAFVRLAAPVTSRYFSIFIAQGGATPIYAGALVIGLALEKYREYGAGRTIIDLGKRTDLPSGGFGAEDGAIKAQFAFSFVDLTDDEVHTLEAIQRDRGLRRPLVVVEDADSVIGRNEAIHYGVFDRFQPVNRSDGTNGWAGTVVEWS